jgi:translation initiation factor IF-2
VIIKKVRVTEMAKRTKISVLSKQIGIPSKMILDKLKELGEFVESVNSSLEIPVIKKIKNAFPEPIIKETGEVDANNPPKNVKENLDKVNNNANTNLPGNNTNFKPEKTKDDEPKNIPTPTHISLIKNKSNKGNNPFMDVNARRENDTVYKIKSKKTDKDFTDNKKNRKNRRFGKLLDDGKEKRPAIPKFANTPMSFRNKPTGGAQVSGAFGRGKRSQYKHKKEIETTTVADVEVPKGGGELLKLRKGATLADFADLISVDVAKLVAILFKLGEIVTSTQSLDEEILATLALELNYNLEFVSSEEEDKELLKSYNIDIESKNTHKEKAKKRPPVITIMGHVDHGKTKLLDALRHSNEIEKEAGGITQLIGAYQVERVIDGVKRLVTVIDTPGHEAFTAMRKRGAHITDVAILVVAADDGVMPQTVEAISHAKSAKVPIVVAINKIDLPTANVQKVKSELMEHDLVPEELGGKTMFVEISAKQKINIDKLLDAVILTADAELDLLTDTDSNIRGTAIEARKLQGKGVAVTILTQNGELKVGDSVVSGTAYGYIRAITDEHDKKIEKSFASQPVRILGLSRAPHAGDLLVKTDEISTARAIAEKRLHNYRSAQFMRTNKRITLENITSEIEKGKLDRLNLIIKAESSGSLEALENAVSKIEAGENEVAINIIHHGVGDISQNDINLASADNAIIIAFNVKNSQKLDLEDVDARQYFVIYDVVDDITKAVKGMLKPVDVEVVLGRAVVEQVFKSSKDGSIAGSIVKSGIVKRNAKARIFRVENSKEIIIADNLTINSLRRFKDDAKEVKEGFECGIGFSDYNDIEVGEIIENFEIVQQPRQ